MFPYLDFFQMIHCMAFFFEPSSKNAFQCVIEASISMIPLNDPLKMVMLNSYNKNQITNNDISNNKSLLRWSFSFHNDVVQSLFNMSLSFEDFMNKYKNISMTDWSHPTWKMIHYFPSIYDDSKEFAQNYKAFISCLQFLLPCPKCRTHLKENLQNHPIDNFFGSKEDLFVWSYLLHQKVSLQLGKKGISLQEAKREYRMN